jgi:hypothetical protein
VAPLHINNLPELILVAGRERSDVEDGILLSSMDVPGSVANRTTQKILQRDSTIDRSSIAGSESFNRDRDHSASVTRVSSARNVQPSHDEGSPIHTSSNNSRGFPWQRRLRRRLVPSDQIRMAIYDDDKAITLDGDTSHFVRRMRDEYPYNSVTDLVEREVDEWSEVRQLNAPV